LTDAHVEKEHFEAWRFIRAVSLHLASHCPAFIRAVSLAEGWKNERWYISIVPLHSWYGKGKGKSHSLR